MSHWEAFQQLLTCEGLKSLSLLPVEAKGVKKGRQALHHHEDGHSEDGEKAKHGHEEQNPDGTVHPEADVHHHCPEHLGQLC